MSFYARAPGSIRRTPPPDPPRGPALRTIEVIIPSRRSALLPRLLLLLSRQDRRPDMVTVVSNSTILVATVDLPWRRLSFQSSVYSIGEGDVSLRRNVGLYHSTADIVLFVDDDELPPANLVGETLRAVQRDGVVWGNYRYVDVDAHDDATLLTAPASLGRAREEPNRSHSWMSCYGGCLGLSRLEAIAVGGFDLAYTQGHEDHHFAMKLARRRNPAIPPWDQAVMVSEPPFVWHRTDRVDLDVEPEDNACARAEHVFKEEGRARRCTRCPFVVVTEHQPFPLLEYEPKHVSVTLAQWSDP